MKNSSYPQLLKIRRQKVVKLQWGKPSLYLYYCQHVTTAWTGHILIPSRNEERPFGRISSPKCTLPAWHWIREWYFPFLKRSFGCVHGLCIRQSRYRRSRTRLTPRELMKKGGKKKGEQQAPCAQPGGTIQWRESLRQRGEIKGIRKSSKN